MTEQYEPLPVAMIGVGGFGSLTLQGLHDSPLVELVGLADQDPAVAERLGHGAFNRTVGNTISDDHLPFLELGVEAIDIIDFAPPEWDTTHDTPENCDASSLLQVGDTLLEFIYAE